MKYISFVIPCYNSEAYMRKCIESILPGGDDVEIIIVNDGSHDNTLTIANEYKEKYPDIVRVIDKENGGHGSGINAGLKIAQGLYFKVVDSDDWVDQKAYFALLNCIKDNYSKNIDIDVYFSNFVYENSDLHQTYVMNYTKRFPVNKPFTWKDIKNFKTGEYVMMHALTYKLDILKKANVNLLEKTFYVDNIFAYQPFLYCTKLYYLPVDFYRYFIGRVDQSVNINNMANRFDQQLRVMHCISLMYTYDQLKALPRKQYKYMVHLLNIYSFATLVFIYAKFDEKKEKAYEAYLNEFKQKNRKLYDKLRWRTEFLFPFILIPPLRRRAVMLGYKIVCKITKWG